MSAEPKELCVCGYPIETGQHTPGCPVFLSLQKESPERLKPEEIFKELAYNKDYAKELNAKVAAAILQDFPTSFAMQSYGNEEKIIENLRTRAQREDLPIKARASAQTVYERLVKGKYITEIGFFASGKLSQTENIIYLTSLLKGTPLSQEATIEEIKTALRGKKILVLGDDVGSLSEILIHYGAEAYGIEYDWELIGFAKNGTFAEDGKPQEQVIRGDVAKLADDSSDLFKTIEEKGPFDLIFSRALFNDGSGLVLGNPDTFSQNYIWNSKKLLKPKGWNLHLRVDAVRLGMEGPGQGYPRSSDKALVDGKRYFRAFREDCVKKDESGKVVWNE